MTVIAGGQRGYKRPKCRSSFIASSLHDFFRGSFSETSTDICIPLKPDMVRRYAFWGSVDIRPTTVKGLKSQHARKKARMGIFQPNWREIKVNAMLAEKIGCGRNLVVEYGQGKSFLWLKDSSMSRTVTNAAENGKYLGKGGI